VSREVDHDRDHGEEQQQVDQRAGHLEGESAEEPQESGRQQ
jgi:hypothetical protein